LVAPMCDGAAAEVTDGHPTDLYQLLGVSRTSTLEELKRAYRKEALKWHPDKHGTEVNSFAEERFMLVADAYKVLGDIRSRVIYDRLGEACVASLLGSQGSLYDNLASFGGLAQQTQSPQPAQPHLFSPDATSFIGPGGIRIDVAGVSEGELLPREDDPLAFFQKVCCEDDFEAFDTSSLQQDPACASQLLPSVMGPISLSDHPAMSPESLSSPVWSAEEADAQPLPSVMGPVSLSDHPAMTPESLSSPVWLPEESERDQDGCRALLGPYQTGVHLHMRSFCQLCRQWLVR